MLSYFGKGEFYFYAFCVTWDFEQFYLFLQSPALVTSEDKCPLINNENTQVAEN